MKGIAFLSGLISGLLTLGINLPASCEVLSDETTNTTVNRNGNNFNILNGIPKGNNLFHSFKEFSIPTGGSATFHNSSAIENIINRVTGGNISNIDGLIKANGSASVFLINPSGIVFGENARLDIGGSFFGTTANSIKFADGTEFSAVDTTDTPLLTVSVPTGLQMGQNPEDITVQGTGYTIATENPFIVTSLGGLRVTSGNTLALIGGNVSLDGGLIAADSGLIELASITEGFVNLNQTSEGWQFAYETVASFGNVELLSLALADVSGQESGSVNVRGKNISVRDGSRIFRQSQGLESGGIINLTASESVEIIGTDADTGELGSVLQTETIGGGNAAEIVISSQNLLLSQGAGINSRTFSPAQGGNITINVTDSVELKEFSPINPSNGSDITTTSFGPGNAGDLNVSTKQLTIEGQRLFSSSLNSGDGGNVNLFTEQLKLIDGGVIGSSVVGSGQGGDLNVDAQSIELIGINFNNFTASALSTSTVGTGEAGNLSINTNKLVLRDGGRVDASTFNSGLAGSVTVNASESVEVSGTVPGSINPSLIISSANILDEFLQQLLGLPPLPSGDSGNVSINTPVLKVTDGAQVTVRNDGTANAGTLQINAENIFLNNQAGITASTKSGEGGDIIFQIQESIFAENNSSINADVAGSGSGGNINLTTKNLQFTTGSSLSTNTTGVGNAGSINIWGNSLSFDNGNTGVFSEALEDSTGNAGNINLTHSLLNLTNRAQISTNSAGLGQAGNINITGNVVKTNRGSITATSLQTGGGNLLFNVDNLIVRENSLISTSVLDSTGGGGNITINSPIIAGFENSDIIANAVQGNGGNINIITQGIFGLEFREELTPESDITASSEFGVNGRVEINNFEIDPSSGLVELPAELTDPSQKIAKGCSSNNDSSFVATGRGGIPHNPNQYLNLNRTWSDIRDLSAYHQQNSNTVENPLLSNQSAIVEATDFIRNENGEIELVALENYSLRNKLVAQCNGENM